MFRASDGASDQLGWCRAAARLGDAAASRVAQAKREVLAVLLCSSLAEERFPEPRSYRDRSNKAVPVAKARGRSASAGFVPAEAGLLLWGGDEVGQGVLHQKQERVYVARFG